MQKPYISIYSYTRLLSYLTYLIQKLCISAHRSIYSYTRLLSYPAILSKSLVEVPSDRTPQKI